MRAKLQLDHSQQLELLKLEALSARDQLTDELNRLKKALLERSQGEKELGARAHSYKVENDDLQGRLSELRNRSARELEEIRAAHQSMLLGARGEMETRYEKDMAGLR
jgi:hypothetical protein